MSSHQTVSLSAPDGIESTKLYTMKGFQAAAGVGHSLIRRARDAGIPLPAIRVGRRKFIKGDAAIQYLEAISRLDS